MRAHSLILLFIILALTSVSATSIQFAAPSNQALLPQTTTTISMLQGTTQPIKVGPGNQLNPHVACSLASYTNDDLEGTSTIRYLDFATNTEHVLPGNGLDRTSDIDGQRIAFTQLEADGDHVMIYDIASQTTSSVPGNQNRDPAIGGNLIAFVHGPFSELASNEIAVYDRSTGNVTQLTNDTLLDRFPSVSPDGKVVVWEKCQPNGTGCDIYSATQIGPSSFTTRFVSGAAGDVFSDTNGQFIAYTSNKSGENDIYLQRTDGSTEMHLSIPGDQRDLRMSGHLLVFESQTADLSYDVFLYDLSSARLYQVTNTRSSETLSDVVAGCNGVNRIVYAVPGAGDFDVYAFTFQLSDSITDQLNDLTALVQSFNLHDGTETSLLSKLQDALAAINSSDTAAACDSLTAFINASQAQSGKKLTANQVMQLVDSATQARTDLGCR